MESSLLLLYESKKADIKKRLEDFRNVWLKSNDRELFAELAFCLCTPQSKASASELAIKRASSTNILFVGRPEDIEPYLTQTGVRFAKHKSNYIAEAREYFRKNGEIKIKQKLNTEDILGLRNWLAENIKGLGMKEASHFLRNIGFGKDVAILDRHILRSLVKYKVIPEVPKTISKQKYLEIEHKVREFSKQANIPLDALDMVFWSEYGSLPIEQMK